jgi:diaminopimelate decarboxylase
MSVPPLLARLFPDSRQELFVDGLGISTLAGRFGTPLFVYDGGIMDRAWERLRAALPAECSIAYSVKANPNPAILRRFVAKGAGLEIASGGELELALSAGCAPQAMLFAGPAKTETEIELALKHDIGEIHLESAREAQRVHAVARRTGSGARVAVRVNPSDEAQGGAMRMGGRSAPFGVDEEALHEVIAIVLSRATLEFTGIHIYSGTQILDEAVLLRQYRKAVAIARSLAARYGIQVRTLDLGGGLGIPYFPGENPLDLDGLREGLQDLLGRCRRDPLLADARFVLEPGRALVGEAGIYVTRVIDVKVSRGRKFVIVDGGMHHHLAASGNLGQVIKRNFPVALVERLEDAAQETVDVVGPLCTPLDVLARDVRLPAPKVGDLVGVFQSGAYARTASPLGFLSHPTPPEVLVDRGTATLIRRRGTPSDLFNDLVESGHAPTITADQAS